MDRAFLLTDGQPWLVNALARQLTQVLAKDPAQAITAAHVEEAKVANPIYREIIVRALTLIRA